MRDESYYRDLFTEQFKIRLELESKIEILKLALEKIAAQSDGIAPTKLNAIAAYARAALGNI